MVIWRVSETGKNPGSRPGRITGFLRWWGAELLAAAPARLTAFLGLSHAILLLVPEGEDFSVHRLAGGAMQRLGLLSQAGMPEQVTGHRAANVECVLRIPSALGLRRQAPIALSALPRGFDAVAGEIERQTPFAPDQVYLGYRVEDTPDARGRVMAHLALAPIAQVDAILQSLARAGAVPDRISLADDAGVNPAGDTLHILTGRPVSAPPTLLLAALAILLLTALASPLWRNAAALEQVQAQLKLARQELSQTAGAARDTPAQLGYLAARRGERAPVARLLNAISAALPDTAYLAQFELSGRTLALQGVAGSASDLIAPLEALALVSKVEFSAPTLRDPATMREQFQITLTLRWNIAPEQGDPPSPPASGDR